MPSRPSGESPRSPMLAASASRCASVSTPPARRTSRFVAASASDGPAAIPSAMPSAATRRSSSAHDAGRQAAGQRLGGAHRRVGEEHVHRPRPADRRGQQGGHAAVGGQPDRRVRRPQAGARAEHDEVPGERQRQPDARRPAVDGDDHGRREVEQGPLTGVDGVGQLGEAAVGLRGEPGDVAADAEVRALGDDLDAAGVPRRAGQGREELPAERVVDGVVTLGARQHQPAHAVGLLDPDPFGVTHGLSPRCARARRCCHARPHQHRPR